MATVKEEEKEKETEGDRQGAVDSQRLTGEQDRGKSCSQDDTVDSTHSQSKRASFSSRRPSYILTTSFSMQYVKSAWSQLTHRGGHRFNTDQEEVRDVETELEQIGESDEDALLGTETHSHTSSFRFRLMKMLRQLSAGFTKYFKRSQIIHEVGIVTSRHTCRSMCLPIYTVTELPDWPYSLIAYTPLL